MVQHLRNALKSALLSLLAQLGFSFSLRQPGYIGVLLPEEILARQMDANKKPV
jgi:hypothetical protein